MNLIRDQAYVEVDLYLLLVTSEPSIFCAVQMQKVMNFAYFKITKKLFVLMRYFSVY